MAQPVFFEIIWSSSKGTCKHEIKGLYSLTIDRILGRVREYSDAFPNGLWLLV
jgi:hypothetical protein